MHKLGLGRRILDFWLGPMPVGQRYRILNHDNGVGRADLDALAAAMAGIDDDRVHQLVGAHDGISRALSDAARATDAKILDDVGVFRPLVIESGEVSLDAQLCGERLDQRLATGSAQGYRSLALRQRRRILGAAGITADRKSTR